MRKICDNLQREVDAHISAGHGYVEARRRIEQRRQTGMTAVLDEIQRKHATETRTPAQNVNGAI